MHYDVIYYPFPVNSQYLKMWGVDSPVLSISFNIEAFLIDSDEFFISTVRTCILQCLQADKVRATKLSRLSFISCTYEIIAFFAECSLGYFIKIAGKTPVFERPINVSNEKRSERRFRSKSMLSMISCVCNLGSLKINTPNFFSVSGDTNFG